ncbi:hypothetical protein [Brucella sp. 2716]|uniref:hypothetical protein n=1 Tax=Brucella sp. 2716 TaxID=2975052 RepID=UPI00217CE755|nr:hypothetical protein [Brucella sp. 2716]UWF60331.1 hypothetical protein NYO66_15180 [Brucella sp. 2716]
MYEINSSGISVDKSYANVASYIEDLNPADPNQIIRCYVNTGRPNKSITIGNDLRSGNGTTTPLGMFDQFGALLTYNNTNDTYSMNTEASGRAVFLVGSLSRDFYITTITVTCDDGSSFSTPIVFGELDSNLSGSLPPLKIAGLSEGNNTLNIPEGVAAQTFNVSILQNQLPSAVAPTSRVAVVLNEILVYCGTMDEMTTSGVDVACSLLSASNNKIGYFIANQEGLQWQGAELSPIKTFGATGIAHSTPPTNVARSLPAPEPILITPGSVTPADSAYSGLKVRLPVPQTLSTGDRIDLYVYATGLDNRTGKIVKTVITSTGVAFPSQDIIVPQTCLAGFESQSSIQIDYQLFDSACRSKGWSTVASATVDKQYPTVLATKVDDGKPANGTDQDSAYATYYNNDGRAASADVTFVLADTNSATFAGGAKRLSRPSGSDGRTGTISFADSNASGETVRLAVTAPAAATSMDFSFAQVQLQESLKLTPDPSSISANGSSKHTTSASIPEPKNCDLSVTFSILDTTSAAFVETENVTIQPGGQSAIATIKEGAITSPSVYFIDNKGAADTVTITASAPGYTDTSMPFSFSAPASLSLNTAGNDDANATANGFDQHSAYAAITPDSTVSANFQTVTFSLPPSRNATFVASDGVSVSNSGYTATATSNASGVTPNVYFIDTNSSGEAVCLTASVSLLPSYEKDYTFSSSNGKQTSIVIPGENATIRGQKYSPRVMVPPPVPVKLEGTAKRSSQLKLIIDGAEQSPPIYVGNDGRWSTTVDTYGNYIGSTPHTAVVSTLDGTDSSSVNFTIWVPNNT